MGYLNFEISLFCCYYLPRGIRDMRAPPLDECPPGVPSSVPCVACSDASSIILSAPSMRLFSVSVCFSVCFSVDEAVPPVPLSVSAPVFPPQETKEQRQREQTRASVIMLFFIFFSVAVLRAFFYATEYIPPCLLILPRD